MNPDLEAHICGQYVFEEFVADCRSAAKKFSCAAQMAEDLHQYDDPALGDARIQELMLSVSAMLTDCGSDVDGCLALLGSARKDESVVPLD